MALQNRNSMIEIVNEHRMLAILRVLRRMNYSANGPVLRDYLQLIGLGATNSEVREHLQQLKEMGLCELEHQDNLVVVTLTEKGSDVAQGRTEVEGVRRPDPECPY